MTEPDEGKAFEAGYEQAKAKYGDLSQLSEENKRLRGACEFALKRIESGGVNYFVETVLRKALEATE